MHSEHTTDQCQRSGGGATREGPPSAAAPGHEGLPGTSRAHSQLVISPCIVHRARLSVMTEGLQTGVKVVWNTPERSRTESLNVFIYQSFQLLEVLVVLFIHVISYILTGLLAP